MVSISDRLDAHDQQLSQLQSSVTAVQASIETVHSEVVNLQKLMVSWMKKQDKRSTVSASYSPPMDDGGVFESFELAQLEALVSRSEERARQLLSVRPKSEWIPVGQGISVDPLFSDNEVMSIMSEKNEVMSEKKHVDGSSGLVFSGEVLSSFSRSGLKSGPDEHFDEVINSSNLDWFEIQKDRFEIQKESGSSHASRMDISSLGLAPFNSQITDFTKSEYPVHNPQSDVFVHSPTHIHSSQYKIGREFSVVQIAEWKPGRDFGWLDYTRPPTFASKLFVLDDEPKPPDPSTNLKPNFLWKLFHGWCKTASQVAAGVVGSYHLWVVHGQGRPPEDTNMTISTLDLKSVSRFQS